MAPVSRVGLVLIIIIARRLGTKINYAGDAEDLVDRDNRIFISISKCSEKIDRTFILFPSAHMIENYIIK